MTGWLLGVVAFFVACWFGFKLAEMFASVLVLILVRMPLAFVFSIIGLVLCITVVFMPIGKGCLGLADAILI